jgi:hypothetical protein
MKVFAAQAGTGSPGGRALIITLTSMPDRAADFRASAMHASGMNYGDYRNTWRCAVTIIEKYSCWIAAHCGRALKELERAGAIRLERARIHIVDLEALNRWSNLEERARD